MAVDRRRKPRRRIDRWMERIDRFTLALLLVFMVAGYLALKKQNDTIQQQRTEAISLLCDMNDVFTDFIQAEPDYPRDETALERLRAERCDELIKDLKASR